MSDGISTKCPGFAGGAVIKKANIDDDAIFGKFKFEPFATGKANTGYASEDTCEALNMDQNDDSAVFEGTLNTDTDYVKKGAKSIRLYSKSTHAIGTDRCYNVITTENWSASNRVGQWVYADTPLDAAEVKLYLNSTATGAQYVSFPALVFGWQYVALSLATLTIDDIVGYGYLRNCAKIFNLYIDSIIRFHTTYVHTLTYTPRCGAVQVLAMVKANTGTHEWIEQAEDTNYIVDPTDKYIIPMSDWSTYCGEFRYEHND
ncbi:MAG: hypothetical protein PHV68_01950 [Candidatus Gastranaerophilales bacterium]|nr:hypothetical protein [Candidatus Gastranaerophilales bacterium]